MNAKAGSRRMVSNFSKVVMIVVALMVLVSAIPNGKAAAWYYVTPFIGRPGGVFPVSPIYVGDLLQPSGYTAFTLYNSSNTGPLVSRSPAASGAQTVGATYSVQKWDGAKWVTVLRTRTLVGTIGAARYYL